MKAAVDVTKVVAAHYYDGRTSTNVADERQLQKERDFEMALIVAGITPHFLPVREIPKPCPGEDDVKYRLAQKGVDVELAIDVLDFAHEDRYDVAVLITGDSDFVPLVRRITSLNKHTLIGRFDFDAWTDDNGVPHRPTRVSGDLVEAASYSLNFNQLVGDRDWKSEIQSLFFMPK